MNTKNDKFGELKTLKYLEAYKAWISLVRGLSGKLALEMRDQIRARKKVYLKLKAERFSN